MSLEKLLFVPDTHRPFHDEHAWQVMLSAARRFKPDRVVILGDFADFFSVSSHEKDPSRVNQLDEEIADVCEGLDELQALGATRHHYVEGNHEFRLARYLTKNAPAVLSCFSVPKLLGLKERGWTFTPYRSHLRIGKLHVTHECGNAGPQAHVKAMATFGGNVVIGHTHRMGIHYAGNAKGESHVAAMFGWLGDASQVDYLHKVQVAQWQQGFGLGWMQPNGVVHLQAVPIVGGKAMVDGGLVARAA